MLVRFKTLLSVIAVLLVCACSNPPVHPPPPKDFKKPEVAQQPSYASKEELALLEEDLNPIYTIGKGDVLKVEVMGRPELNNPKAVVSPDGKISVPLLGSVTVEDQTPDAAQKQIQKGLSQYYKYLVTTVYIEEFTSMYVTVVGRTERSGAQKFSHPPTIMDVLASTGAMPILDKTATLTKCAIIRGRDKVIWLNLKSLMQGDVAYNMRLKRGDIVYIPDSADTAVYVLGWVKTPGSYRLTPRMSILDAISQAGGLTEDADIDSISVYRNGSDEVFTFSLYELMDPARKINFGMEDGDVIYANRSGMGTFGYYLRQVSPAINFLLFGASVNAMYKTW